MESPRQPVGFGGFGKKISFQGENPELDHYPRLRGGGKFARRLKECYELLQDR